MKLYLLYHSDQWLTISEQSLVAVCTSVESVMEKATEYARTELNIPSMEDERPEEPDWDSMTDEEIEDYQEWEPDPDKDYLEDIVEEMEHYRSWNGHENGLRYEEVETDQFCY